MHPIRGMLVVALAVPAFAKITHGKHTDTSQKLKGMMLMYLTGNNRRRTLVDGKDVDLSASSSAKANVSSPTGSLLSEDSSSSAEASSPSSPIVLTFSITRSSSTIPTLSPYRSSSKPEMISNSGVATGYVLSTGAPVIDYTTVTVSTYTTFCPTATKITQGTETYTATASQTITVTNCPCIRVTPIKTTPYLVPTAPSSYAEFPGYGIVPSPTFKPSGSGIGRGFIASSATIPVFTPAMLGNAYGGGKVSTPSVYVTKLPFPNGPSAGIPPGYGFSFKPETSLALGNSSSISIPEGSNVTTPIPNAGSSTIGFTGSNVSTSMSSTSTLTLLPVVVSPSGKPPITVLTPIASVTASVLPLSGSKNDTNLVTSLNHIVSSPTKALAGSSLLTSNTSPATALTASKAIAGITTIVTGPSGTFIVVIAPATSQGGTVQISTIGSGSESFLPVIIQASTLHGGGSKIESAGSLMLTSSIDSAEAIPTTPAGATTLSGTPNSSTTGGLAIQISSAVKSLASTVGFSPTTSPTTATNSIASVSFTSIGGVLVPLAPTASSTSQANSLETSLISTPETPISSANTGQAGSTPILTEASVSEASTVGPTSEATSSPPLALAVTSIPLANAGTLLPTSSDTSPGSFATSAVPTPPDVAITTTLANGSPVVVEIFGLPSATQASNSGASVALAIGGSTIGIGAPLTTGTINTPIASFSIPSVAGATNLASISSIVATESQNLTPATTTGLISGSNEVASNAALTSSVLSIVPSEATISPTSSTENLQITTDVAAFSSSAIVGAGSDSLPSFAAGSPVIGGSTEAASISLSSSGLTTAPSSSVAALITSDSTTIGALTSIVTPNGLNLASFQSSVLQSPLTGSTTGLTTLPVIGVPGLSSIVVGPSTSQSITASQTLSSPQVFTNGLAPSSNLPVPRPSTGLPTPAASPSSVGGDVGTNNGNGSVSVLLNPTALPFQGLASRFTSSFAIGLAGVPFFVFLM